MLVADERLPQWSQDRDRTGRVGVGREERAQRRDPIGDVAQRGPVLG